MSRESIGFVVMLGVTMMVVMMNVGECEGLPGGDVVMITPANFESIVLDTGKDVMVDFFAGWCPHCQALEPIYAKVATHYVEDQDIVIAAVDCVAEPGLCSDHGVRGYPTVRFYSTSNKEGERFAGQRTVESFIEWIDQKRTTWTKDDLKGWQTFGDQSFKAFPEDRLDWEHAVAACQEKESRLGSLSSPFQFELMLTSNVTAGLKHNEMFWLGLSNTFGDATLKWVDGTAIDDKLLESLRDFLDDEDLEKHHQSKDVPSDSTDGSESLDSKNKALQKRQSNNLASSKPNLCLAMSNLDASEPQTSSGVNKKGIPKVFGSLQLVPCSRELSFVCKRSAGRVPIQSVDRRVVKPWFGQIGTVGMILTVLPILVIIGYVVKKVATRKAELQARYGA